jgi:predicted O-linked N-acetylglucosamine transferase (SPINDLY family)
MRTSSSVIAPGSHPKMSGLRSDANGEAAPQPASPWLRAQALQRAGRLPEAIELFDAILREDPQHAEAYYKRGNAQNALGRWEAALADYDRAVTLQPGYANALCNRGAVLVRLRRWQEALQSLDRALELNPADALAHYNRGSALTGLKRAGEALGSYDRAIAIDPGYADAYCNRGNVLQDLHRHEDAVLSYGRAVELNPTLAEGHLGRGVSLAKLRRSEDALADYRRALELRPDYAEAFINCGGLLQDLGRHEAAVASYDRALAIDPTHALALQCRGYSLHQLRRIEQAIQSYDSALALEPDRDYLLGMRLHAQMHLCEWRDLPRDLGRVVVELESRKRVSPPLPLLALVDSPRLHRLAAEVWVQDACPPDETLGPIAPRPHGAKIHVGYFSADFRNHAVSMLTVELFERHDRSRFEVTAFAFGPRANDAMRARLERAFDRFIEVSDRSDADVALLARRLGVDIAVDLGGFTSYNRAKIFALRAAPLQLNFLGYPGTSGAPFMDYLIADRTIIHPEERDHYSEKIIHLPSYQPNESRRPIAAAPQERAANALPAQGLVFCCFNNSYKITPAVFDVWMRILAGAPGSVLWLRSDEPPVIANLKREARARGIAPERLVFAPRAAAMEDHLARHRLADLFLDTWPYGAHTTASDALWAGLPILTHAGRSFASRVGASLLTAVGLPELIATTPAQYEEMALSLAADPQRLMRIRQKLTRTRASTLLFDAPKFTKGLESAFVKISERDRARLPPEDVYL